jgi:hypothetical protein
MRLIRLFLLVGLVFLAVPIVSGLVQLPQSLSPLEVGHFIGQSALYWKSLFNSATANL